MKKGLRLNCPTTAPIYLHLNLALMKKGLRHIQRPTVHIINLFKPCPDEEGIKTRSWREGRPKPFSFKPCPDEEGIKTTIPVRLAAGGAFKPCPDEEGIKTPDRTTPDQERRNLNLALMKKGLRRHPGGLHGGGDAI